MPLHRIRGNKLNVCWRLHKTFLFQSYGEFYLYIYVRTLNDTTPINPAYRQTAAIACKVMIVKLESFRVRVGSYSLALLDLLKCKNTKLCHITHNVPSPSAVTSCPLCIQGRGFCTLVLLFIFYHYLAVLLLDV